MRMAQGLTLSFGLLAGLLASSGAQALSYVINVTVDPKAATLPEAKEYLAKATKVLGTNFQVASFEEVLTIKKDGTYSVKSVIPTGSVVSTVTPLDKVVRLGDGKVVNGIPSLAKSLSSVGLMSRHSWR